jgi:hypothetical protein
MVALAHLRISKMSENSVLCNDDLSIVLTVHRVKMAQLAGCDTLIGWIHSKRDIDVSVGNNDLLLKRKMTF